MPRNILLILGHPDPDEHRLCRALATAYADAASAAGHTVTQVDLATLDVPFLRTQADFEHGEVPESLRPAVAAMLAADHIVLIFPLWLGTMPALVKAFLEQALRPGIAFAYRENRFPQKLLTGRSARLVVTMGMPALLFHWLFFDYGVVGLKRNTLRLTGIKPIRETLFGSVGTASPSRCRKWCDRMRALGTKGL